MQEMDFRKRDWRDERLQEFFYLPDGKVSQIRYTYTNAFISSTRDTFSYNSLQQCSEKLRQFLQNHDWISIERTLYGYDSFGRLLTETNQIMDTVSKSWVNSSAWEYVYDSGKLKTKWHKLADTTGWINEYKTTHTYDAKSNLIEELMEILYKPQIYAYTRYKTSYNYNPTDKKISAIYQNYDSSVSSWINSTQILYLYNSMDSLEVSLLNHWNSTNKTWVGYWKTEKYFAVSGRVDSSLLFQFSKVENIYFKKSKYIIKYLDNNTGIANVEKGKFKIYPNPAKSEVNIKSEQGTELLQATFTDINGKEIMALLPGQFDNIDVSALANGIYIVRVQTTEGVSCQKIIIQH